VKRIPHEEVASNCRRQRGMLVRRAGERPE
jgi:hypothetical protein